MAACLQVNSTLTDLRLCENEINDKGAESIAKALSNNNSIVRIDLSANKIGAKGVRTQNFDIFRQILISLLIYFREWLWQRCFP